GKVGGVTVALLTTTGRKSGKSRMTPLLTKKKGDDYIVVASFSGHDAHPFWYLNLSANPQAKLTIGRETYDVVAVVTEGEERESLYKEMTEMYDDYAEYQKVTDRVIPVVRLTPP
ncbi:MAG: nitroreductase family deazaflavin-dependent oxidoreductase, partial [Acidimicrobiales bacterium]